MWGNNFKEGINNMITYLICYIISLTFMVLYEYEIIQEKDKTETIFLFTFSFILSPIFLGFILVDFYRILNDLANRKK